MNDRIPPGTQAERREFARDWIRQRQIALPGVRLSRFTRRIAVGCFYCLVAAMPIAYQWPLGYGFWLYLAAVGIMWAAVNFSIPAYDRIGDSELDERERELRLRARAMAYRIISVAFVVLTFYFLFAATTNFGLPMPSRASDAGGLLVPALWVVLTLPRVILAWTIPTPVREA
jgi:hypothetical protein